MVEEAGVTSSNCHTVGEFRPPKRPTLMALPPCRAAWTLDFREASLLSCALLSTPSLRSYSASSSMVPKI